MRVLLVRLYVVLFMDLLGSMEFLDPRARPVATAMHAHDRADRDGCCVGGWAAGEVDGLSSGRIALNRAAERKRRALRVRRCPVSIRRLAW